MMILKSIMMVPMVTLTMLQVNYTLETLTQLARIESLFNQNLVKMQLLQEKMAM